MVFGPAPEYEPFDPKQFMAAAATEPFMGAPELGGELIPDVTGEAIQQGAEDSFGLGTVIRDFATPAGNTAPDPILSNVPLLGPIYTGERALVNAFRPQQPSMTPDEYKASPYFRTSVPYDPGMTEDRAAALADYADTKARREYFNQLQPLQATVGAVIGQGLDPVNYVPIFGEAAQTALAARFGSSFLAKLGSSMLINSAGAAINTAAFGELTAGLRGKFGDDVSWNGLLNEVSQAALIGAGFGAFGTVAGETLRGVANSRAAQAVLDRLKAGDDATTSAAAQAGREVINDGVGSHLETGEVALNPNSVQTVQKMADELASRTDASRELDVATANVPRDAGAGKVAITPAGTRVAVSPEIVDASQLQPAQGALQVRNRDSVASNSQVEQIASQLDPQRLLPSVSADQGAPIVGPDGIVDSGNGRVAAIIRASQAYPAKYEAYKQTLRDAGYQVPDTGTPILISRRTTELSDAARQQFNAEANAPAVAQLNPVERAAMDRAALDQPTLDQLDDTAPVTSPKNAGFIARFMQNLSPNERGALVDPRGNLNQDGQTRVENALVAKAYADVDDGVLRKFAESTDDNTRSIVGAMADVAGRWAKAREAFKRGDLDASLDPTPALTSGLRFLSNARDQAAREGRAVSTVIRENMAQMDMLGGGATIEARAAVRAMYQNDHFAKAVGREVFAARLGRVLTEAEALARPQLFDNGPVGVLDMYNAVADDETRQGDIFAGDGLEPGAEVRGRSPGAVDSAASGSAVEGGQGAAAGPERPATGGVNGEGTNGSEAGGGGVSGVAQPEISGDARYREEDGSLAGLPRKVGAYKASVYPEGVRVAQGYMGRAGLDYDPPNVYVKADPVRGAKIAEAFDAMKHDPADPEVKAAYDAMIKETLAQYRAMTDDGMRVEFAPKGEDPYKGNPRNMTEDVRNNRHMWVFSTDDGFGSDETANVADNPLLATTTFKISGRVARANDIFRAVHDYFGHVKEGVGFRADGEENAWRSHSAMYSANARRAMTTETRGQNSWVNFGPFGEANRTAGQGETHYADQKIGLLPEWVAYEGAHDPLPYAPDRYFKQTADTQQIPLDLIDPTRARPKGIANAAVYMRRALRGEMLPRQGISLRPEANGRYTLLDGNSTYANAKANGWPAISARVMNDAQFAAEEAAKAPVPLPEIGKPLDLRTVPNDKVKDVTDRFIASQPARTVDELYDTGIVQRHQAELLKIDEELRAEHGIEPATKIARIKDKEKAASKMIRKSYRTTSQLTDLVRTGFVVAEHDQADKVIAGLAKHFKVLDEGWVMTEANYFDRKVLVQFKDGTIGEVQFWHPEMLEAKNGEGHKLYEAMRELPPNDPERAVLNQKMRALYDKALETADPKWKDLIGQLKGELPAAEGSAGTGAMSGKISANALGETGRPESTTSMASTDTQSPELPFTMAAADMTSPHTTAGRPSQLYSVRSIPKDIGAPNPVVDASPGRVAPEPEGMRDAVNAVGKDESFKEILAEHNVDETGTSVEEGDVAQIKEEGRLTPVDEADMAEAARTVEQAASYGKALQAAASCII